MSMKEFNDLELDGEPILQFFSYEHLPAHLQEVSKQFATVAEFVYRNLPKNAERTAAFRKLIEAKDCAVRARVAKHPVEAVLA